MSTSTTSSSQFRYRDDFGLYWPDYDWNPTACHALCMRRVKDVDLVIPHLKGRQSFTKARAVCVQAGGHAGLWPIRLAGFFERVYTFECEPTLYQCLLLNCREFDNIIPSPHALGDKLDEVKLLPARSAGSWRVDPEGTIPVKQVTIDAMGLEDCNALILDIEGYEIHALVGAKETIERCSPVIMVEMLPRIREVLQTYLKGLGYQLIKAVHADGIFVRP